MFLNCAFYHSACLKCLKITPVFNQININNKKCITRFAYLDLTVKQKPSPEEVAHLHQLFTDPQNVINSLVEIMIHIDPVHLPSINIEPRPNGTMWRACLHFTWPVSFQVSGESTDRERAQHYAYLSACKMFEDLGLLSSSGKILNWKSRLEQMQDSTFRKVRLKSSLNFLSSNETILDKTVWTSTLQLKWPCSLTTVGKGVTQKSAETAAAALAFVKLKSLRFLDKTNQRIGTSRFLLQFTNSSSCKDPSVEVTPDYEMWVDASKVGYGAYLVSNIDKGKTERTRWFGDFWPNEFHDPFIEPKSYTTVSEFYAIVCAVYTWKKKFEGRSLLIWSDSLQAVTIINEGLMVDFNAKHGNAYLKLFTILLETCSHYCITLRSRHLSRTFNQAADSLSKLQIDKFFSMVPNASPKAKKSKKLLFFLPFVDMVKLPFKSMSIDT